MPAGPVAMSRDGGLVSALLDYVTSLKDTTLTGFATFSRDFAAAGSDGNVLMPRLNISSGANRIQYRTCQRTMRRLTLDFEIHAEDETSLTTQGEMLDAMLEYLSENTSTISSAMATGAGISEMEIVDQNTTHLRTNLWSRKVSTEWDITLVRN